MGNAIMLKSEAPGLITTIEKEVYVSRYNSFNEIKDFIDFVAPELFDKKFFFFRAIFVNNTENTRAGQYVYLSQSNNSVDVIRGRNYSFAASSSQIMRVGLDVPQMAVTYGIDIHAGCTIKLIYAYLKEETI